MDDLLRQFYAMNFIGQTFFVLAMAEGIWLMSIYAQRSEKQRAREHAEWLNSPEGQAFVEKCEMSRTRPPGDSR